MIFDVVYAIMYTAYFVLWKFNFIGGEDGLDINTGNLPTVGALAYLGDARHSLFVRMMLVSKGISKSADLNREALKYVTAEAQASMCRVIMDEFTESELGVYKRAFNSTHLNKPKHTSGLDYRMATGFEAVVGMLSWLGMEERLMYLLNLAHKEASDSV